MRELVSVTAVTIVAIPHEDLCWSVQCVGQDHVCITSRA